MHCFDHLKQNYSKLFLADSKNQMAFKGEHITSHSGDYMEVCHRQCGEHTQN